MQGKLLEDYEALYERLKNSGDNEVVQLSLDGGGFKG
jgi:hypothetical protein